MKSFITNVAKEAGELAMSYLGKVKASSKGEKNIVTEADKAVEALIIKRIKEKYPEHNIISEESLNKKTDSNMTWYIDPIDGTNNFMHGNPNFCVSIALAENNELKYACINIPMMHEIYYAEKGRGTFMNDNRITVSSVDNLKESLVHVSIRPTMDKLDETLAMMRHFTIEGDRARDLGFCAGELAFIAAGRGDSLIKYYQNPWDIAAGILLVEEAGGKVTDEFGEEILMGKSTYNVLAANNHLHEFMLNSIKKLDTSKGGN